MIREVAIGDISEQKQEEIIAELRDAVHKENRGLLHMEDDMLHSHNVNPHVGENKKRDTIVKHSASYILKDAEKQIRDRADTRDINEERSSAKTVEIFNAITGNTLTEKEGWIFLISLKLARAEQGKYNPDDYLDLVGYAALLAEHADT